MILKIEISFCDDPLKFAVSNNFLFAILLNFNVKVQRRNIGIS